MKTRWIWIILGGIVLLAIGFLIGFGLRGVPLGGRVVAPMMGAWPGHMVGWRAPGMFFGLRGLFMLLFCLGPLAGIIALIVVLTRRSVPPATPPTVTTTKIEETKTE